MKYSHPEVEWVAGGIRAYLLAKMDSDDFPIEFYEEAKRLIGFQRNKDE